MYMREKEENLDQAADVLRDWARNYSLHYNCGFSFSEKSGGMCNGIAKLAWRLRPVGR